MSRAGVKAGMFLISVDSCIGNNMALKPKTFNLHVPYIGNLKPWTCSCNFWRFLQYVFVAFLLLWVFHSPISKIHSSFSANPTPTHVFRFVCRLLSAVTRLCLNWRCSNFLPSRHEKSRGIELHNFADNVVNYRHTAWMNGFDTFQTDMQSNFVSLRPVEV